MSQDPRISLIAPIIELLQENPLILSDPEVANFFRASGSKASVKMSQPEPKVAPVATMQEKVYISALAPSQAKPLTELPKTEEIKSPPPSSPSEKTSSKVLENTWRSSTSVTTEKFDTSLIKTIFPKIFPSIEVLTSIPKDDEAKKLAHRYKTKNQIAPILILTYNEPPQQKLFLDQIALAINVCFMPCKMLEAETLEKEKLWETVLESSDIKLIIACDYTLWQLSHLMRHFKENPTEHSRTLGKTPLLLLPDLSLYLKDPQLKRSLWKALCHKISL